MVCCQIIYNLILHCGHCLGISSTVDLCRLFVAYCHCAGRIASSVIIVYNNTHGKDSGAFPLRAVVETLPWPSILLNRRLLIVNRG